MHVQAKITECQDTRQTCECVTAKRHDAWYQYTCTYIKCNRSKYMYNIWSVNFKNRLLLHRNETFIADMLQSILARAESKLTKSHFLSNKVEFLQTNNTQRYELTSTLMKRRFSLIPKCHISTPVSQFVKGSKSP